MVIVSRSASSSNLGVLDIIRQHGHRRHRALYDGFIGVRRFTHELPDLFRIEQLGVLGLDENSPGRTTGLR